MTIGNITDHSVYLEKLLLCGEELTKYGSGDDVTKLEMDLKSLKTRYTILNDKACYQLGLIKDIPDTIEQFHDLHKFIQHSISEIEKEICKPPPITNVDAYVEV